jgi:hypothetical protein
MLPFITRQLSHGLGDTEGLNDLARAAFTGFVTLVALLGALSNHVLAAPVPNTGSELEARQDAHPLAA